MKKITAVILICVMTLCCFSACGGNVKTDDGKLKIVCTIFPLYDWVKNILGDEAENAELTLKAATFREESRGSHFREDFPERNDKEWLCWVKMKKDGDNDIYTKEPIPERFRPDFNQPYDELYPMTFPDVVKVSGKE